MFRKNLLILTLISLLLAACASAPTQTDDVQPPAETPYPGPRYVAPPTSTPSYPEPAFVDTPANQGGTITTGYEPQPGDDSLARGNVFIDESQVLLRESMPVQASLLLKGNLPTPCHVLRVVANVPTADKRIDLEVYSLADKTKACIDVLQPFEADISLGSLPGGKYTVYINGEKLLEFDV